MTRIETTPADDELAKMFFTPAEGGALLTARRELLGKSPGIPFGHHQVDRPGAMRPLLPGDTVGLVGRPGHGKSTILAHWAISAAKFIQETGYTLPHGIEPIILYISLEQLVEEIEALFQCKPGMDVGAIMAGNVTEEALILQGKNRLKTPIWTMGRSLVAKKEGVPRFYADNLYRAIRIIEKRYGKRPVLILLDYIQILPVRKGADRTKEVTEAVIESKELAQEVGAAMVFGVQSGRGPDKRDEANRMPSLEDSQHSSAIEQTVDKLFGIWRPHLSGLGGKKLDIGTGAPYTVTPDLFVMKQWKQRWAPAGQWFVMSMAPELVRLADFERGPSY